MPVLEKPKLVGKPARSSFAVALQGLLFVSGFSALLLEVTYVKLLRYWAGNTAYAVAAVLSAYMAGLALGSFGAGKWLPRSRHLLGVYAGLELLVGLYSVGLPGLMGRLEPAYLDLTSRLGPDTNLALVGHFLAATTVLLFPTVLMGASFPVMVRAGSGSASDRFDVAERLYAANLTGAALGTLLSDFLLLRFWGLGNTLRLVALLNAGVAGCAVFLGRRQGVMAPEPESPEPGPSGSQGRSAILPVALAGGFLVLFQEIVWTHMMGRFLDNTVYGFAVVLFVVIGGLGLGAILVARNGKRIPAERLLPWACVAAGALALLLTPFWDYARVLAVWHPLASAVLAVALLGLGALALARRPWALALLPSLLLLSFLFYRWNPPGSVFWILHGFDFSVCVLFMAGPAVLMGMIFPLLLERYLGAARGPSVAPVYASNTFGSLAGIVVATFFVLPRLGVEWSGRAASLGLLALGLWLLARWSKRRTVWLGMAPALVWALMVPAWDYSKTHRALRHDGQQVFAQEDLDGGITTVLRIAKVSRLYTNEIIQAGNGELVSDQARCALVPLLHARELKRAAVIGLGSGETAGIVGLFPFERIDLVDFSPGVVEAGRKFFEDINLGIYDDPRVRVHIADGRHYLLTHPEALSLLTIEVSRLWVAGEGDLYTREFYDLGAASLGDHGVLLQWVPLFRLSFQDTLIILRTVRAVFPHVAMYLGAESGMIVASRAPLQVDYPTLRRMDSDPRLQAALARIGLPSLFSVLGDCVLVPEGVDALLAQVPEKKISSDLWPHLEYSTAGYYFQGMTTGAARQFFLASQEFRTVPVLGLDAASRPIVERLVLEERGRQVATRPPS
jgi:spermidine synthase